MGSLFSEQGNANQLILEVGRSFGAVAEDGDEVINIYPLSEEMLVRVLIFKWSVPSALRFVLQTTFSESCGGDKLLERKRKLIFDCVKLTNMFSVCPKSHGLYSISIQIFRQEGSAMC